MLISNKKIYEKDRYKKMCKKMLDLEKENAELKQSLEAIKTLLTKS